jgi:hypothetical protein
MLSNWLWNWKKNLTCERPAPMLRYKLRTLMIVLALGPPVIAAAYSSSELAGLMLLAVAILLLTGLPVYRTVEFMLSARLDPGSEPEQQDST